MPVQRLNRTVRDEIYRRTLATVASEVGPILAGHCLEFAWQGYRILKDCPGAPRTIIQAGSARWPRVPPELDDGAVATHFSYEWDPSDEVTRLLRAGIIPIVRRADGRAAVSLPEMHVWLGCPDTGEVIDFTTGLLPAACKATIGEEWLAPPSPDYFWHFDVPPGVSYVPARDAIDTVIAVLRQQGRQYP